MAATEQNPPAPTPRGRRILRSVFRWGLRILAVLAVLAVLVAVFFDPIVTALTKRRIREATGLEVELGRLDIGVLRPELTLTDFKLHNTPEFGGALLIDLPELHLEYDREALGEGKLHLKLVRLNLAQLTLVKGRAGRTNITELFTKLERISKRKRHEAPMAFAGLDTLHLTLGKVVQSDLGKPGPPKVFDLRVKDQVLTGLKTEQDLQTRLLAVLLRSGVHFLTEMISSGQFPSLIRPPEPPKPDPVP